MNEGSLKNKILVAVDGSEQSLKAIRYAAKVLPPDRTHIVLFHIQEQLLDLFSELDTYPHYKKRVTGLKHWATEQKREISNTMDSAVVYFKQNGFPESAISIKTPSKSIGVSEDIIRESYDGYHAIVVGRTGWSRFKDWLLKSTAMKLVAKIKHIPIVVVGGQPDSRNMLVTFDGTRGAMKAVACAGALVRKSDSHIKLYSIISNAEKFWVGDKMFFEPDSVLKPIETGSHRIGPLLEEARLRLLDAGMDLERISIKIHAADMDRSYRIVEEANENQYGSVVIGRRGMISFIDSYFVGRVSDKVLKLSDQLAVWII